MILAMINNKGGTGKTTSAVNASLRVAASWSFWMADVAGARLHERDYQE